MQCQSKRPVSRVFVSGLVAAAVLSVSGWMPAHAAMVTTEQLAQQHVAGEREARVGEVRGFLARADVRQQLEAWGVAPELAEQRVAALSDAELERLSSTIADQPAGGDILVLLGVIFVVLLVLELVGVTNVFSRF